MDTINTLYDGEGYYVTIEDSSAVSDELVEAYLYVPEITVTSRATIRDLFDFDTIVNIVEDPGYAILKTEATHVDSFSHIKNFTIDENNAFIGVSKEFLWHIPVSGNIQQKFLYPNCEGDIIDCKWHNGYLYVLHNVVIPADEYHVISDRIGIWDSMWGRGRTYGTRYVPYEFDHPLPEYRRVILNEYPVFRLSKYNINGELEGSANILSDTAATAGAYTGDYLLAPSSFDIFEDKIYIADTGDASIKAYTLYGSFIGRIITSSKLFKPLQIFIETENYFWVVDTLQITTMGFYYAIKRIDVAYNAIESETQYKDRPYMSLSKSGNITDVFVIMRENFVYKFYKNFSHVSNISTILNAHSLEKFVVSKSLYAYFMNCQPMDIRRIKLTDRTTANFRECTKPVTVQDYHVENELAVVSDSSLEEVGIYHLFGERDSVLIDHVVPKGIAKIGDAYFVTDIRNNVMFKIQGEIETRILNRDFVRPFDVATDGEFLYVLDMGRSAILKLNTNGLTEQIIGSNGVEDGMFSYPTSITIHEDIIYVLDSGNFKVQTFTLGGEFLSSFSLSPALGSQKYRKTLSIPIAGDEEDVYLKYTDYCELWGDMLLQTGNSMIGFRFPIELPRNIEFVNVTMTVGQTPTVTETLGMYINMEATTNAQPFIQTTNYPEIAYREAFPGTLNIYKSFSGQGTSVTTPNLASLFNRLVAHYEWNSIGANNVVIFFYYINGTSYAIFKNNTAVLNITYDLVKTIRPKGLFYHLIVDDSYIYISDISDKKINVYNKSTGEVEASYPFFGTLMEKLDDNILITNKYCSITFLDKFAWETEFNYTMEIDDNADHLLYTFEPTWDTTEYVETFEQTFEVDFIETYEWFDDITFVEVNETEYDEDLLIPTITWVI